MGCETLGYLQVGLETVGIIAMAPMSFLFWASGGLSLLVAQARANNWGFKRCEKTK